MHETHAYTFEDFLNEGTKEISVNQKLIDKIGAILGDQYEVSYDKNSNMVFVKSELYRKNSDSSLFYKDVKYELEVEGIEIGGLNVYSNTEIAFSIIDIKIKK